MSATINARQLHNCGPTMKCPGCKATVYVGTMERGKCVFCNLKPKPQPEYTMEGLIAAVTAKMEVVK